MKDASFLSESVGSLHYASPQIVKGQKYNGTENDAWSLGVMLYTMITAEFPFYGKNNFKLAKKISKGKFELPSLVSPEV